MWSKMIRLVTTAALCLLLAAPLPARATDDDALSARVRTLVSSDTLEDAATMLELLERGLPPAALGSFLAATTTHPRAVYSGALRRLLRYRRVDVRGRAVVSLVRLGGMDAQFALLRALDDADPRIRELGVRLSATYTDPAVEEALARLREREPELFETSDDLVVEVEDEDEAEPDTDLVLEEDA